MAGDEDPSGAEPSGDGAPFGSLTPRETQVLRLLARAATNRELAAALGISCRTVESHLSSIYRKLGVRSRLAAVIWARSNVPDQE